MADQRALDEREARRLVQDRFLAAYDEVKAELIHIPGIVNIGMGLRERGGVLTNEPAFRVYVDEKLPLADVQPLNRIPAEVRGFPIDVIKTRPRVPKLGFNDENDKRNYKTKVGGSKIGVDIHGTGGGTLGCFVSPIGDPSTVLIMSAQHVLMPREFKGAPHGKDAGVGVGQPDYSGSLCCVCNEIAKNVEGDKELDCAFARLKPDVKFAPKVRRIKRSDGSVELTGVLKGADFAVQGNPVWKVGEKSGLTRGTLSEIHPFVPLEVHASAPFAYFIDNGDSGSVLVDAVTEKVVGLLHSGPDHGATVIGFATRMSEIIRKFSVDILATDESQEYDVMGWDEEERIGVTGPPTPDDVFAAVADRLRMTEAGSELLNLFGRHKNEIFELVNHRRPVTIAWQRSQGPAYLAAWMRSVREPVYRVPESLNGVTRQEIAGRLREAFTQYGSDALRAGLASHAHTLSRIWLESSNMEQGIAAWERSRTSALVR
jgi:hypothetical protein